MNVARTMAAALEPSPKGRADAWLERVRAGLTAGALAPYLGPGVAEVYAESAVPTSFEALAEFLGRRVSLPRRARGNVWAAAQFIETYKHRKTLDRLMDEAFRSKAEPGAFHEWLASRQLPLVVDSWYDGTFARALGGRSDWVEIRGSSRSGLGERRWFRVFGAAGEELPESRAESTPTVLYEPHGVALPDATCLISDADYVEALTEIDIQSPIPEVVRERRRGLGFVFLGCRFHDQLLRTYARQITKHSAGPRFALWDPSWPCTRNERRFFDELGIEVLVMTPGEAFAALSGTR